MFDVCSLVDGIKLRMCVCVRLSVCAPKCVPQAFTCECTPVHRSLPVSCASHENGWMLVSLWREQRACQSNGTHQLSPYQTGCGRGRGENHRMARRTQCVDSHGAESVLGPGISTFSKRGSLRHPCSKERKCFSSWVTTRGHQGPPGPDKDGGCFEMFGMLEQQVKAASILVWMSDSFLLYNI